MQLMLQQVPRAAKLAGVDCATNAGASAVGIAAFTFVDIEAVVGCITLYLV